MIEVIGYVLCVVILANLLFAWFETSISIHLIGRLFIPNKAKRAVVSFDEMMDVVDEKSQLLADLLSCPICLGTWLALPISALICCLNGFSPWFVPACMFSAPLLAYLIISCKDSAHGRK